ncbi:MAG: DM13 domain-containing protein [Actinomycetes bacterium]
MPDCTGMTTPVSRRTRLPRPPHALAVPVLAALGGLAFLVWRPGIARSMAGSPRALGFTLAVGALVLALGWLVPRLSPRPAVTVAAQLVPVALAFVVTVLPAFHQVTVDEPFPAGAAGPAAAGDVGTPAVLGRAAIRGIDHRAQGTALLVRRTDGMLVARLESLDVEPGPDYQVHLVPGPDRHRPDGGTHLGRLRGNRGNQNYAVPDGVTTDGPVTVLIWCRAFGVPVAAATLR